MRVVSSSGSFDLGTTEATPTIGITDFSRRVTDDFGVTMVVERGFARRMSVRLLVPTDRVDALQAKLADLRATAALWVVDPALVWLNVDGFYKDFEIDHAVPPVSYCTLTVEGLADPGPVADSGADPAADGKVSSLRMVEPVTITDAVLTSSSVAEDDAPAWSSTATYAKGATVIRAHRIYESLIAGNTGADPATETAKWLDTGPTNRWAPFDQALGTATIASAPIALVLKPGVAVSTLAILDTNAATVRAQAPGYDRTVQPSASGKAIFLDLVAAAGASVTITITPADANPGPAHWDDGAQWMDAGVWRDSLAAGDGTVTVGTILIGALKGLGVTEASPTAGITDFSKKTTDDFGETVIVQRAFAKRMAAKALIRTDAIDIVANRIAAVRARPCLWIARTGQDSLTVYGFFKDFSIEVGRGVSKLSLSIEGMAKATPLKSAPIPGGGSDFFAQGSVDGVTWHDGLQVGDVYLRTSTDNGATYGPAIKFVGEDGTPGEDGSYQQQIFKRSPTRPATPTGGGIPAGWSDGVPDGTDLIWLSVQYQRNGVALGAWSLPAQIKGDQGNPGANAPLVITQWSVDGSTGWHDTYQDGDVYQRQSPDNGATWGPAVRVVGESASAGADGISPSIVFRRSATVPNTPTRDTGNPPPGWSDAPPAGTDFLWQSVTKYRGVTQLESWSAPVRISGADGASAFTILPLLNMTAGPNSVTKTGVDAWDGWARTAEKSLSPEVSGFLTRGTFLGLTTRAMPVDGSNTYTSVDYGWHWSSDNTVGFSIYRNGTRVFGVAETGSGMGTATRLSVKIEGQQVVYRRDGEEFYRHEVSTGANLLYGAFVGAPPGTTITGITFAMNGVDGKSAPLVRTQWSINGVDGWHDNYFGGDIYYRQSNDNGVTWGPAIKGVGETGTGVSTVFRRSSTVPATPGTNTGNPPAGWSDGPPAGTDFLWLTKANFVGSTQTTAWSAPQRISGENGVDGFVVKAISNTYNVPFFATGAVRPDWQGGVGTIELRKGGAIITSGVTYAVEGVTGVTSLTLSGNQFSFTGISTDKGGFTVVATYQGGQYRDVVSVKRTYDGSAAFTAGNPGVVGPNGVFDTVIPPNRQVRFSVSAFYDITNNYGTWTGNVDLYYQNLTDGGPEVYAGNSVGSQASRFPGSGGAPGEPDGDVSNTGQADRTVTFTSGNGNKTYRFRYVVNRTSGSTGVTVSHSGAIGVEVQA